MDNSLLSQTDLLQKNIVVLLVDDSEIDRKTYIRYLQKDNNQTYHILEAETLEEGLRLWQSELPDLVLLDVNLPDGNGLELLKSICNETIFSQTVNKDQDKAPVIVLTGEGSERIAVKAMKLGAAEYLLKEDLTQFSLVTCVNNIWQRKKITQRLHRIEQQDAVISKIALKIRQYLSVKEIAHSIVEEVRKLLAVDRAVVYQFNSDASGKIIAESVIEPWTACINLQIVDTCFQKNLGGVFDKYQAGKISAISDVYNIDLNPCHLKLLEQFEVRANLVVPIILHQTANTPLWGLLVLHQCSGTRIWTIEDVELLQKLTVQLAIAIQQAQLYESLQELNTSLEQKVVERTQKIQKIAQRQQLINDISNQIRSSLNAETILNITIGKIASVLQCDRVMIYQICPKAKNKVIAEFVKNLSRSLLYTPDNNLWEAPEWLNFYHQGIIQVIENIEQVSISQEYISRLKEFEINAQLAMPIMLDKQLWGLIVASNRHQPYIWQTDDIELMEKLATQVTIGLQQSIIYYKLQEELDRRQESESRLQKSEKRYATLTRVSPVVIWHCDLAGNCTYVNPYWSELTGMSYKDTMTNGWQQAIHPEDRHLVFREWERVLQENGNFEMEYRLQTVEEKVRWVYGKSATEKNQDGQVIGYIGSITDITKRKLAEEELKESKRFIQGIADASPNSLYLYDIKKQKNIYVNREVGKLIGYTDQEIQAMGAEFWPKLTHPDDLIKVNQHFEQIHQIENNEIKEIEYRLLDKSGRWRWFLSRDTVFNRDELGKVNQIIGTAQDISDRKQAQEELKQLNLELEEKVKKRTIALQESEMRWQFALEGAGEGVWDWNAQTNQVFYSPQWKAMLGYGADEIGNSLDEWDSRVHPEDKAQCYGDLNKHFAGETPIYQNEHRMLSKDGSYKWILARGKVIERGKNGEPLRIIGTLSDITARKEAEQEKQGLIQQLTAFKLALDQAAIVTITDTKGVITYVNERFCEVSHYSKTEIIGETHRLVNSGYHPSSFFQKLWETITQGKVWQGEICNRKKNGELYWVDTTVVPFLNSENQPEQYLAIRFNITERKQAQIALQGSNNILRTISTAQSQFITAENRLTIFDGLLSSLLELTNSEYGFMGEVLFRGDGSAIMEENLLKIRGVPYLTKNSIKKIAWNETTQKFYAENRATGMEFDNMNTLFGAVITTGKPVIANHPNTDYHPLNAFLGLPLFSGSTMVGMVGIANRPNGYNQEIIEYLQPFLITCGSLLEGYRLQRKRKEAEQKLQLTNQELIRATRLKDEFLANMSHELRTPLNAILGMSEGLQDQVFGELNPRQVKATKTIYRSGSHLLELINDILDLAKIESGKMELDCHPVSVPLLCKSSMTLIQPQALKKQLTLELKLPSQLADVFMDERRMRQVLINLLNNAVKFTPEKGKITLEVNSIIKQQGQQNLPYLRFAVKDTGIGIAPENIGKLFQPFVQIDSALNRKYAGTGLGLVLVKQIVELHGGDVGVTSKLGVGSCFTVEIKSSDKVRSYSPQQEILPESNSVVVPTENKGSPLILLVEDNEANINTITSYLTAKGYRLITAQNGKEALALVQSATPDLILMDVQIPDMDGLEIIKQIRLHSHLLTIPIIALTALAMKGDRQRCLAAGANDYMSKPVKLKQLTTKIQEYLVK